MVRRILVAGLALAALAGAARAEEAGFTIAEGTTIRDILRKHEGKTVMLHVGDEELSGKVQAVGGEVVHLGPLAGKDFYDAAVRIQSIDAVLVRVRGN